MAVMDLKPRYTARKRKKNRNEVDAPARQPTVTAISEIPQPMLGATAVRHDQYLIRLVFIRDNLTAKQHNAERLAQCTDAEMCDWLKLSR